MPGFRTFAAVFCSLLEPLPKASAVGPPAARCPRPAPRWRWPKWAGKSMWSAGSAASENLKSTIRPPTAGAAAGLNGKLFVIGGFVEGWTPTDDVHEYDPASDRWQRLAALPTTRGALAAAVLDGKIYAVGGIGWRGRNTAAHEFYDPAANRWTALAPVPMARDHLAVAALNGRLYAVGGRIDGNYSRNLSSNEAYDPATDRWEQRAPMPTARSGIAAAVLEGRMFV